MALIKTQTSQPKSITSPAAKMTASIEIKLLLISKTELAFFKFSLLIISGKIALLDGLKMDRQKPCKTLIRQNKNTFNLKSKFKRIKNRIKIFKTNWAESLKYKIFFLLKLSTIEPEKREKTILENLAAEYTRAKFIGLSV